MVEKLCMKGNIYFENVRHIPWSHVYNSRLEVLFNLYDFTGILLIKPNTESKKLYRKKI